MVQRRSYLWGLPFAASLVLAACGGSNTVAIDAGSDGGADGSPNDVNTAPDTSPPPPPQDSGPTADAQPDVVVGPACTSDAQCSLPTPYCDPGAQVCVQCLGDPNCTTFPNGRRTCDTTSHTCVQCTTSAQCGGGGGNPYCSPANQCVQCLGDANCTGGQKCDPNTYRCAAPCTGSGQCTTPTPYCNTTGGYCVQCLADANCANNPNGFNLCNTSTNRCVECLSSADCGGGGNPYCLTTNGRCVECLSNTNCPANSYCQADYTCF